MDTTFTIFNWIGNFIVNLFENDLFVALFVAIIAALLAYLFALRSQRKLLQEQQKFNAYKLIQQKRDEYAEATINLAVHTEGIRNEFIGLNSIDNTRNTMRGIVAKQDYEYDKDLRDRWGAYCAKIGDENSRVMSAFTGWHQTFEQTFFMYPKLKKAFYLLRDENDILFDQNQKLASLLYAYDGANLIKPEVQDELVKKLKELNVPEKMLNLQCYAEDYFKLVQHALTGSSFKFKPEERKPQIGKTLTLDGWKYVTSASDNKLDAKMIALAKKEAKKSDEPVKCGVVLVDKDGQIITKAYNTQRKDKRTANHAEMNAIAKANETLGRKLNGVTAYCSCEPCTMCLTALIFASVDRIVFAEPLNDAVPLDKQINVECFSFATRFPSPPKLEWFRDK